MAAKSKMRIKVPVIGKVFRELSYETLLTKNDVDSCQSFLLVENKMLLSHGPKGKNNPEFKSSVESHI